jgi:V/A-type H+-transporting ATPase subunit I
VPAENLDRLRESAELGEDLVLSLGKIDDRAHVLVIGAGGISPDLEGLLAKAHFAPVDLTVKNFAAKWDGGSPSTPHQPETSVRAESSSSLTLRVNVKDSSIPLTSDEILANVAAESSTVAARLGELERDELELRALSSQRVLAAAGLLARAAVFAECEGALEGRAPAAFLSGWVPLSELPNLERQLRREIRNPVAVVQEILPRETGRGAQPPSLMPVPLLFRSGARLVTLYGQPGYGELNPTIILAATAPLFFGMMFGDVGQGLLLAILALALRRRLGTWLAPALACSLGCTAFGFLYGSAFGFEGWLPALWLRPMSEPFRLLAVALWIGVVFLLITFVLKVANLLLQGRWFEAACSFQGLAGAIFYAGGVIALRAVYCGNAVPLAALVLGTSGVVLTAIHAASEIRSHGREALTNLTAEYFHGLISLFTNTLSFLRLAAFALNHAALSLALFLLVEMIPPTPLGWAARILALVTGSTFILTLDALVVAVQTIRLEFYEGLTRYFRGDGQPYQPLRFPETKAA